MLLKYTTKFVITHCMQMISFALKLSLSPFYSFDMSTVILCIFFLLSALVCLMYICCRHFTIIYFVFIFCWHGSFHACVCLFVCACICVLVCKNEPMNSTSSWVSVSCKFLKWYTRKIALGMWCFIFLNKKITEHDVSDYIRNCMHGTYTISIWFHTKT